MHNRNCTVELTSKFFVLFLVCHYINSVFSFSVECCFMSDLVSSEGDKTLTEKSQKTLLASQFLGGAVVICLAGAAFSTGFIYSLARSQKKLSASASKTVSINAYASALKALLLGSAAAVFGVGGTVLATCKLVGISSLEDLRTLNRKGSKLNIPRSSVGRSEFANLQELADYLVEEDKKKKSRCSSD
ncbi:Transmembrane protein [Trichinella pseudospiralis]